MRGQVAMEYLMIVGFSLLILIPIIAFVSGSFRTNDALMISQLEDLSREISSTAEKTYYQGPGAKETMIVRVNRGVTGFTVLQNSSLNITTFEFTTRTGLTITERTDVPVYFGNVDLSNARVHHLVFTTVGGDQPLNIQDDKVMVRYQNE